jgi:hypothetical protein
MFHPIISINVYKLGIITANKASLLRSLIASILMTLLWDVITDNYCMYMSNIRNIQIVSLMEMISIWLHKCDSISMYRRLHAYTKSNFHECAYM